MGVKICYECGAKDAYELRETIREYEGDGYHFEMLVKVPFCTQCGAPIYDQESEKEIVQRANQKIREQREIITREEILEILDSYHVSQKFLSRLLGWGDITLTRYIGGNYTPNMVNSNRLKELRNPYVFQMLVQSYENEQPEQNEEKCLKKAANGVFHELNRLKETQGKIFDAVNWFLSHASEEVPVTHLALQKLLYFTQSWSAALLGEPIFYDDCQAWVHGAVYPKVYEIFKKFKYMPLPKVEEAYELKEEELTILNAVKKHYFDVYNAKALEEICHRETPYIETRRGYSEEESCQIVIDKEQILKYYIYLSQRYGIDLDNMSNIKIYLNNILSSS